MLFAYNVIVPQEWDFQSRFYQLRLQSRLNVYNEMVNLINFETLPPVLIILTYIFPHFRVHIVKFTLIVYLILYLHTLQCRSGKRRFV